MVSRRVRQIGAERRMFSILPSYSNFSESPGESYPGESCDFSGSPQGIIPRGVNLPGVSYHGMSLMAPGPESQQPILKLFAQAFK